MSSLNDLHAAYAEGASTDETLNVPTIQDAPLESSPKEDIQVPDPKRVSFFSVEEPVTSTHITIKRGSLLMDSRTGQAYQAAEDIGHDKGLSLISELQNAQPFETPIDLYTQAIPSQPYFDATTGQYVQPYYYQGQTEPEYGIQQPVQYVQPYYYQDQTEPEYGIQQPVQYVQPYDYQDQTEPEYGIQQPVQYVQPYDYQDQTEPEYRIQQPVQNVSSEIPYSQSNAMSNIGESMPSQSRGDGLQRNPSKPKGVSFTPSTVSAPIGGLRKKSLRKQLSGYAFEWVGRDPHDEESTIGPGPVAVVKGKGFKEVTSQRYCCCFRKRRNCMMFFTFLIFLLILLGVFAYLTLPGIPSWKLSDPYLPLGSSGIQLTSSSPLEFYFDVNEDIAVYSPSYFEWAASQVDVKVFF
jgi:hypothetical protein